MQRHALLRAGRGDLILKLKAYIVFRMGLGMTRPRRVDDISGLQGELGSCPYLATILTRRDYYALHKYVAKMRRLHVYATGCKWRFYVLCRKIVEVAKSCNRLHLAVASFLHRLLNLDIAAMQSSMGPRMGSRSSDER